MKQKIVTVMAFMAALYVQQAAAQKIQYASNIGGTKLKGAEKSATVPLMSTMKGRAVNGATPAYKVSKATLHPAKKITVVVNKQSKATAKQKTKAPSGLDSLATAVKGNLQLPLESCTVAQFYGHTNMGSFKLYNPGITFVSPAPVSVKASYDALVETVVQIEGMYVVITSCKNLYMGYSNLEEVFVKKGDSVKTGKPVGTIAMDETGNYTLLFLLQVAEKETNPQYWFNKEAASALIKKEW